MKIWKQPEVAPSWVPGMKGDDLQDPIRRKIVWILTLVFGGLAVSPSTIGGGIWDAQRASNWVEFRVLANLSSPQINQLPTKIQEELLRWLEARSNLEEERGRELDRQIDEQRRTMDQNIQTLLSNLPESMKTFIEMKTAYNAWRLDINGQKKYNALLAFYREVFTNNYPVELARALAPYKEIFL